MKKIFYLLLLFFPFVIYADQFEQDASYKVCFTPDQNCTDLIVNSVKNARKQILVQAYSFTSAPIAAALVEAAKKGVEVKIIVDKSQNRSERFSPVKLFTDHKIPTYVDYRPRIAHNKVMIIDNKTVITGSFNFTRAAQNNNAENVIIISDSLLARKYLANWWSRKNESDEIHNKDPLFFN